MVFSFNALRHHDISFSTGDKIIRAKKVCLHLIYLTNTREQNYIGIIFINQHISNKLRIGADNISANLIWMNQKPMSSIYVKL